MKRLVALAAAACASATACTEVTLVDPIPYDYTTGPVAIVNPDWGVIPLPNDFLNPIRQADLVSIPGVEPVTPTPTGMALPVVDAAAAQKAQDLGYDVAEDDPLSRALIVGQNRLDGFLPSFAPSIPFSRPVDPASVVPYDGANAADANFWLVDVTDPAAPQVVAPADYLRIFNWQLATEMPFKVTLRLPPEGVLQPPRDFTPGHTYLVVATGWTDKGLKEALPEADAAAGLKPLPVVSDGPFLLFAAPTEFQDVGATYIGPDGLARSGVVSGLAAAQSLEGGRQITDWGLKVWEGLPGVAAAWTRAQVVTAYSFTIATNPTPDFFDPLNALLGGNAVKPTPADSLDKATGTMTPADAGCDDALAFAFDKPVKADTVDGTTVRLFQVEGATYTEVPLDVAVTDAAGKPAVKATPRAALKANTLHLAAVTSGIRSADGRRPAADQSYFGVARAALKQVDGQGAVSFQDTPLVTYDGSGNAVAWNSPYLDSRLDTLILSGQHEDVTSSQLKSAGNTMLGVLDYLEKLRKHLKPHLDHLVLGARVVPEREDVVLAWTFTTGACQGGAR